MNYYDLPAEKRWLGENSPYNIGGRSTDVSQIVCSLERRVKEMYPPNEVPAQIASALKALGKCLAEAETNIENFIALVSDYRRNPRR